jgi:UDP-N-acetylglucosamine--N-acetylmuramyl-(pentapeptide) pyrophosphoryl-undecaprenol N-acetylglucosamine transferase
MKRLLIAASGTGGHLFPALAVAEYLKEYQIEWLGVADRMERSLVPSDYPIHIIKVQGFQSRKISLSTVKVILSQLQAVLKVKSLLSELKIDAVFTTGGYIAAPAILAAYWAGIPVVLHESNSIPGKVTRFLSRFCTVTAIGFRQTASYLKNTKLVGNPVRDSFLSPQSLDIPLTKNKFLIVVVGGSQGAIALNNLVRFCVPAWVNEGAQIVHLTGEKDNGKLDSQGYHPFPFYKNMAGLFQRADLVISRSGSATLAELAVTTTPSILIPFPYAAEDHQYYNARAFEQVGAALVYRQEKITAEALEQLVLDLIKNPEKLEQMRQACLDLAVFDSAQQMARIIREL